MLNLPNIINKYDILLKNSDPMQADILIKSYLNDNSIDLFLSSQKQYKYMLYNEENNKFIHFGKIDEVDYLKNGDEVLRKKYMNKYIKMNEEEKKNKLSKENLNYFILFHGG